VRRTKNGARSSPLGEELSEARGDLRLLGENVMVLAGILREIEKKR
jgi:hypothetical protein